MQAQRPDLEGLPSEVQAYIEYLESALAATQSSGRRRSAPSTEPSEAPTSRQVISISRSGRIKRTARHHYSRQRRGGMGVFDLENEGDPPAFLVIADLSARLFILTDRNRYFSLPVETVREEELHSHGEPISTHLPLQPDEGLAVVLPDAQSTYLNILSDRGWVRRLSATQLGHLKPGMQLEVRAGHRAVAGCWSSGTEDLFIVSRQGKAIRFGERQVPISGGCLGIRLDPSEEAAAITAVDEESGVFIMGNDGKGTIRLMSGFRSNKSPGAGGKVAMKLERLVGAQVAPPGSDIFATSALGKVIRFQADEIPPKEGVVQGVNCMSLRADETVACTVSDGGAPPSSESESA